MNNDPQGMPLGLHLSACKWGDGRGEVVRGEGSACPAFFLGSFETREQDQFGNIAMPQYELRGQELQFQNPADRCLNPAPAIQAV